MEVFFMQFIESILSVFSNTIRFKTPSKKTSLTVLVIEAKKG
jgi:hypothetical protein